MLHRRDVYKAKQRFATRSNGGPASSLSLATHRLDAPFPSAHRLWSCGVVKKFGLVPLLLVAAMAFALVRSIQLRWVCDDAFVSFRYADNLVDGLGLVYNAGERVEGYTNLSWTLLLALFRWFGAAPIPTAEALGIVCTAALVATLIWWSHARSRRNGEAFFPLAALFVLAMNDLHIWATGGLETMLFAWLAVVALLLSRSSGAWPPVHPEPVEACPEPRRRGCASVVPDDGLNSRQFACCGVVLGLLLATRPDAVVFVGATFVSILMAVPTTPWRPVIRRITTTAIPFVVMTAALVAFKLSYYDELLPTAFYSKSASQPYLSQGVLYVALFLARNWFLVPTLLVLGLLSRRRKVDGPITDAAIFLMTGLLFAAYVIYTGGDFMFARRLIPAVPFFFLAMEEWFARVPAERLRYGLATAAISASMLPYPIYSEGRRRIAGIADEPSFYPAEAVELRRQQAEAVGSALRFTGARVMFEGGMCMFAYFSRLPYLVEMTGLTQYSLAKLPIRERGVIGHEKQPTDEWLTENQIHFIVSQKFPYLAPPAQGRAHDEVYFSNLAKARIWIYSDDVMDSLRRRPEVSFVPIENVLAQSREAIARAALAAVSEMFAQLDRYYFTANGERGRAAAAEFSAMRPR